MNNERTPKVGSFLHGLIETSKDFVSLLRDLSILVLAVMLILFPKTLNSILVEAGFEEGSFVGFKWKAKLVDSDKALQEAQIAISSLQAQNDELVTALEKSTERTSDSFLKEQLSRLEIDNKQLKIASEYVQSSVAKTIAANAPLVEKARSDTRADTTVRFCYQEDRLEDGPKRYSVHCHSLQETCETARGPHSQWKQSACERVDLTQADWKPRLGGFMGSRYEFRSEPFPSPFPKIR